MITDADSCTHHNSTSGAAGRSSRSTLTGMPLPHEQKAPLLAHRTREKWGIHTRHETALQSRLVFVCGCVQHAECCSAVGPDEH